MGQRESDLHIWDVVQMPGWSEIKSIAEAQIKEDTDLLLDVMGRNPDNLTDKASIKHAARRAAMLDFLETVSDRMRILESQRSK